MNGVKAMRRKVEIEGEAAGKQLELRPQERRGKRFERGEMVRVTVVGQNRRPDREGGDGGHAERRPDIEDRSGGGRTEVDEELAELVGDVGGPAGSVPGGLSAMDHRTVTRAIRPSGPTAQPG